MIEYRTGDILTTDAEALVNSVNCVGIMGRGVALQFKNAFPENFKAYAAACKRGEVRPGRMFVFETGQLTNPRYIINFPTKRHWRGRSRIEDVESGLEALAQEIRRRGIRSVAIPPLGAGLGGLAWRDVRHRIELGLLGLDDVQVFVYEPRERPVRPAMLRPRQVPKVTPGRAALVVLIHRYLGGLLDPFVSLLEVHKLMYFLQEAGQPLKLRYAKAPFGPYAQNLRHVLMAVEGHLVTGCSDGGETPTKQLQLIPGSVEAARARLKADAATSKRLERVTDLVGGFETPFGLELLSTVHWVAAREGATSAEEAIEHTYAWGDRKARFTRRQIGLAFQVLQSKGWLKPVDSQGGDHRPSAPAKP
jgi:O-acetyl-ADP-ribose deacetylase (regulator of RNase III)